MCSILCFLPLVKVFCICKRSNSKLITTDKPRETCDTFNTELQDTND